ncbi:30S ribosomal protein S19e [Candidatus Pacearchaeota archaeon CG10_big_fil_rev_8_21_14_0_10_34_76]|nr:MAG: 30S ribosomal protein S19e [Candidatus Pacearchaeota archaeon CG10_big_fil_rev_8_21_14_0_10_34_76]
MTDIRNIEAGKYNTLLAAALKESGDFEQPEWVNFVKTGTHKVRPVNEVDFWYKRSASILRQVYIKGIVGVERLRTRYGGRKNRGAEPAKFYKGAGKIIRTILKQAEEAGLVETVKDKKPGRRITAKGREFMEKIVGENK